MMLNKLIYKTLVNHDSLNNMLAIYNDQPAVFYKLIPEDSGIGWNNESHFPRLNFSINVQAHRKRKCFGSLKIQIMCFDTEITSEEIETEINECLNNIFLQEDGHLYYISWAKSETFHESENCQNINSNADTLNIYFDIIEYPNSETLDPDPIGAMILYTKSVIKEAVMIGIDNNQEIFHVNDKNPAFYFRLASVNTDHDSNAAVWMNCKIAIHIFTPSQEFRIKWAAYLMNLLAVDGEIVMSDESPMFVKDIKLNGRSDYLREGQLLLSTEYGLPRYRQEKKKIVETAFNMDV